MTEAGRRVCFALDLVEDRDLIAAYEAAHAAGAVPPPVVAGIRAAGWTAMEIWRVDDRLFMVGTAAGEWPRPLPAALAEAADAWEAAMDRFQRRLAGAPADGKWSPMRRIFSLDEQ